MDTETSLEILAKVRAARNKQAEEALPTQGPPRYGGPLDYINPLNWGKTLADTAFGTTKDPTLLGKGTEGVTEGLSRLPPVNPDQLGRGAMAAAQASVGELTSAHIPYAEKHHELAKSLAEQKGWDNFKNVGLGALALGGAGAGVYGLMRLLRRNATKQPRRGGPSVLPLPYPVAPENTPEAIALPKRAGDAAPAPDAAQAEAPAATETTPLDTSPGNYMPFTHSLGLALAGLGGVYGGYKGISKLMQSRRKREQEAELDAQRKAFHEALLGQYGKPLHTTMKQASEPTPGDHLDAAFNGFCKLAGIGTGLLAGYGGYAGISALLAGSMIYNKMKKRSRRSIIDKAVATRERDRFQRSPSEIYAQPEPVTVQPQTPGQTREEMKALGTDPE